MKIKGIKLENYRAFKQIEISDLSNVVIFIGANGTGKSTLFDVLVFLSDALASNITEALAKRGGFKEVISRQQQNALIKIELQMELEIFGLPRLATYLLHIGEKNNKPYIAREILKYKRHNSGPPFHFLSFANGKGYAVLETGDSHQKNEKLSRDTQELNASDVLAVKGLGQFSKFKAAGAVVRFIERWQIVNLHINKAFNSYDTPQINQKQLSPNGENLPLVTQHMSENSHKNFANVVKNLRQYMPEISDIKTQKMSDGKIMLSFQNTAFKKPFGAAQTSDGTIRLFAYQVLLHNTDPHPLLCIETPEMQIYPTLMYELLDNFRLYAKYNKGQVWITSHSSDLLNGATPCEVYWLHKTNGYSTVWQGGKSKLLSTLYANGEQLGRLWQESIFLNGDQPPD